MWLTLRPWLLHALTDPVTSRVTDTLYLLGLIDDHWDKNQYVICFLYEYSDRYCSQENGLK